MISAERTEDRDTGHREYAYPPTGEQLTSVTSIQAATLGKPWIPPWVGRITSELAVDEIQYVLALLRAKDRTPDERHDAAVTWLKEGSERIRDVKRAAGTYIHDVVEKLILWAASPGGTGSQIDLPILPDQLVGATYDDEPLTDIVDFMIDGFLNFVADFNPVFEASEMTVYNQPLGYAGTLDIILALLGYGIGPAERLIARPGHVLRLCVDVKTGRKPEVTWREQLAAYRRAREANAGLDTLVPMPATDSGAVLHLRPEHHRGYQLMPVSAEKDALAWERFRKSCDLYHGRRADSAKPGKVIRPLRADGTMPPPLLADLAGEGYGRAPSALRKAQVGDLEQLAAMTAGQCLATKGIGGKTLDIIRLMLADHGLHLAGETTAQTPTLKEVA